MSDWIPTSERLPDQQHPSRLIFAQNHDGERYTVSNQAVDSERHIAWMELPPPYVPPKPNRYRCTYDGHNLIEVLPGDPDPDVVLDVLDGMRAVYKSMPQLTCIETWTKRIEESRSK